MTHEAESEAEQEAEVQAAAEEERLRREEEAEEVAKKERAREAAKRAEAVAVADKKRRDKERAEREKERERQEKERKLAAQKEEDRKIQSYVRVFSLSVSRLTSHFGRSSGSKSNDDVDPPRPSTDRRGYCRIILPLYSDRNEQWDPLRVTRLVFGMTVLANSVLKQHSWGIEIVNSVSTRLTAW